MEVFYLIILNGNETHFINEIVIFCLVYWQYGFDYLSSWKGAIYGSSRNIINLYYLYYLCCFMDCFKDHFWSREKVVTIFVHETALYGKFLSAHVWQVYEHFWKLPYRAPFLNCVNGPACVCCQGTKCPLLTAFFLFSLSSEVVTFLPEGVIIGFPNFEWGFKSK